MNISWQGWLSFSGAPFILFIVLLAFTHLIYQRYFRFRTPVVASGAIIMALGIFALECLPRLFFSPLMFLLVAFELLIVWIYLGMSLVHAYFHEELHKQNATNRMEFGTWVPATALIALLIHQVEPTLHGFIVLLVMITMTLFFIYLSIVLKWLRLCFQKKLHLSENGLILLVTVSIQSVVILLNELFQDDIPLVVYQVAISAGVLFYLWGIFAIFRYTFLARTKHFLACWPNANCINHGAVSITGLAMIDTQSFSSDVIIIVAYWAIFFFVVTEIVELFRLATRVQKKGVKGGLFIYFPSQWARVFTFGMFYAFSLAYFNHEYLPIYFMTLAAHYGQYVVTALLLIELFITLSYVYKTRLTGVHDVKFI